MTVQQRFVLVGPHKGKTMSVNGHTFENGEYTFSGSPEQVITLTNIFSNYAALPEQEAELNELRELRALRQATATPVPATIPASTAPAPTPGPTAEELAAQAEKDRLQDLADEEELRKALEQPSTLPNTGAPADAPSGMPTLAEAIGALDPENDTHWTSNNLPAVDHLTTLVGKKVTRNEVEEVADGYTRAKARAARAN